MSTEQLPDDYSEYDDICPMCGGDGVVMLSDCGPSEWGEDCFCEEDSVVPCPECREAFLKKQETNPNANTKL